MCKYCGRYGMECYFREFIPYGISHHTDRYTVQYVIPFGTTDIETSQIEADKWEEEMIDPGVIFKPDKQKRMRSNRQMAQAIKRSYKLKKSNGFL